jgi:hypothetical protein
VLNPSSPVPEQAMAPAGTPSNGNVSQSVVNDEFEAKLASNPNLKSLSGRMLFICDGNHKFKAWTGYIKRLHSNDRKWHYSLDSICLDTRGKGGLLLNAMHDINK